MDNALRIERVVLLGLVTLVGATGDLMTAIAALVVSAAAGIAVCGVNWLIRRVPTASKPIRWGVLIAVGFGISWAIAAIASYTVPLRGNALLFLRLAGVMPIVYYAVADGVTMRESLVCWVEFGALLIATAAVREFFGRGTLFGYLPAGSFTIPAGFFGSTVGAFLVLATVVLGARLLTSRTKTSGDTGGDR
ncbi:MAG: hypothetical protein EA382_18720 [Spirochaetaceae bacterium]|nr:MAG: hypothetical protein EA382_18720 [Spirochaetaceae bacterium]